MFGGKSRRGYTPVGLDIRDSVVHAVQFAAEGGARRFHAAASVPIATTPDSKDYEEAVLDAMNYIPRAADFRGRDVVIAVPNREVDVRPVTLPADISPADPEAFQEALLLEARACLLYPIEEAIINYLFLDEEESQDGQPTRLLLLAARRDSIDRQLARLEKTSFQCALIDSGPRALLRALSDENSELCVIDLDWDCCTVAIGSKHRLLFSRTVDIGLSGLVSDLAVAFSIEPESALDILIRNGLRSSAQSNNDGKCDAMAFDCYEACSGLLDRLANEIGRSIAYFSTVFEGRRPPSILLTGAVLLTGLGDIISARLHSPVVENFPTELFDQTHNVGRGSVSALSQAAGLALCEEAM